MEAAETPKVSLQGTAEAQSARELASIFRSAKALARRVQRLALGGQAGNPATPTFPKPAASRATPLEICSISEKNPARRLSVHRRSLEPGRGKGGRWRASQRFRGPLSGCNAKSPYMWKTLVYQNPCLPRHPVPFFPLLLLRGLAPVHSDARQYGAVHALSDPPY